MWNIFGRYRGRKVLPSARQMNLIAAILNHVTQGTGISMSTPQMPSTDAPWVIGIDVEWLKAFVGGGSGADLSGVGANKIVGTDANSAATAAASLLTTAPTVDKVLTTKKNGTTLTWEDADRPAENPSSTTNLSATYPGNDVATNNSWTAGGTTGLTITQLVRVKWSGTYLYGYYRTFKYDKYGRLYSVSAETRYTIDTPVTYNP